MNKSTKERLEKSGWAISDAPDFLGLSKEQLELIDLKISLGEAVRQQRQERGLSQKELAKIAATSQPRLAKLEQGEASLDALLKVLFALDARRVAARIIGGKPLATYA